MKIHTETFDCVSKVYLSAHQGGQQILHTKPYIQDLFGVSGTDMKS